MKKEIAEGKQKPYKKDTAIIRSSAAEYLTFIAIGGGSEATVEIRYEDENIWLTQKMMATLYDVSVPAINQHLKRIFADNELTRKATVKQYLIVQTEGSREVRRKVEHYSLQAIIAVDGVIHYCVANIPGAVASVSKSKTSGRCSSANGPIKS